MPANSPLRITEECRRFFFISEQFNAVLGAQLERLLGPIGGLYLADMCLAKKEHAHTRLTDTATDGVGKLAREQCLVEGKLGSLRASTLGKLTEQSFFIS